MRQVVKKVLRHLGLLEMVRSLRRTARGFTAAGFRERKAAALLQEKMLHFYGRFIGKGNLVFDVGANIGNRTDVFVKLGATVVSIEPQEECIKILKKNFGRNRNVHLVQKGLAGKEGEHVLFINSANIISSMSSEWISAVRRTGRFSNPYQWEWNEEQRVPVTTLDRLIEQYGFPDFCKIDVEGFEFEVLKGLSQPIRMLSMEFTPEFMDATMDCIRHLTSLGSYRFNYSLGESMVWALPEWVDAENICRLLNALPDRSVFGDVYARQTP